MDYMKKGSLDKFINRMNQRGNPCYYFNTQRQIILIGIVRGMMVLHKLHIIHRDLKPGNILLDSNYHPRITDFGLSKFFDPNNTNNSDGDIGTTIYMAPEVLKSNQFSYKADVYSFGILMYELITGKRGLQKYPKKYHSDIRSNIISGLKPKFPQNFKKGFKIMIDKCLSLNPKERPTFSELYKKLSLSEDDYIFDLESTMQPETIYSEDEENEVPNKTEKYVDESDDDNDIDKDEDEEEARNDKGEIGMNIDKRFCFDSVNYTEIFNYVDEINVDPIDQNQQNDDQIEQMRKEIEELKSKQIEEIEQLKKQQDEKIQQIQADFSNQLIFLRDQIDKLNASKKKEIKIPISLIFQGEKDTRGIIDALDDQVILSAGGNHNPKFPITSIKKYDDIFFYNYYDNYVASSESASFIEFDLGPSRRINLHSYFIRSNSGNFSSNHPKSWRIEGSNDKVEWITLDKRENDQSLRGSFKSHHFECQERKNGNNKFKFRYIRFVQNDSWRDEKPYDVQITYFELYGDVF